jgi:hypothetical protein
MHPKITSKHLGRGAVVYIRQSTMGQVAEYTESQRRQYALADSARTYGFASVTVIACHIAGVSYRAGKAGAQATAQSERIRPWLVANRFHVISQASMMSARLRNTELASQWLRR